MNKLDPSQDYAVPEPLLPTSTSGVRDGISLNQCPAYVSASRPHSAKGEQHLMEERGLSLSQCPAYESATVTRGDGLREGLYDIVATS